MEDSNKTTLADKLHLVGLFILGIFTYLGANYIFEGNFILAGGTTLILLILIWLSIHLITKQKKDNEYRRDTRVYELLCYVFWVSLSIGASYLMLHGQNVEIYLKKEIQIEKEKEINELALIIESYRAFVDDNADRYSVDLDNEQRSKKNSSINNIDNQVKDFKDRITLGLIRKENEITTFVTNGKVAIKNWDRFEIPQLLKAIPDKKNDLLKYLLELSVSHPFTKAKPFKYQINSTKEFILSRPESLYSKVNIFLALISILIVNFLVLLPVLAVHSKKRKIREMKVENTL